MMLEPKFRKLRCGLFINGTLLATTLIFLTWLLGYLLILAGTLIHPYLGNLLQIITIYYCVSIRSLRQAAMDVSQALYDVGLETARQKLAWIVGREVKDLSEDGISRAAVETVAENLVDGVISPLFFAAIGGAPLALAYKMINTLDSMVGYKNETYRLFGKTAARIDDVANFVPARLSVPVIALVSHILADRGKIAFKTAFREGRHHSSPNAGFSEAAFAGALAVKLGGPNMYHGKLVEKPYIGDGFESAHKQHIKSACELMMLSAITWGAVLTLMRIILKIF
jgi:adenosylcobinamide-phosphate synthase